MIRNLSMLSLTALLAASACVSPVDDANPQLADEPGDEPATSETTQSLSVFNWTASLQLSTGKYLGQTATIGSRMIMVQVIDQQLYWRERTGVNAWSTPALIPNHLTTSKPSLAAFNGYLYMIHVDSTNATRLWMSRFTPSTSSWSTPYQLSHVSWNGPPAMVAYNNALHLVGVTPGTYQLWHATMNTSEALSPSVLMAGQQSYSRVSAAVAKCKLYVVHRANTGTTVAINWFNGTSWSPESVIPAGPGGAAVQAWEPVIAERAGYLHLVYRTPTATSLWWTYFNGTSWPAAVTIGAESTIYGPSLATGGSGLVAMISDASEHPSRTLEYAQSLPIIQPLPCTGGAGFGQ